MSEFVAVWEEVCLAQRTPYGVISDLSHILGVTAEQRTAFAEMDKRLAEQDRKLCVGGAAVVSGAMARGIVTAVFWLSPPVYPYKVVENDQQAVAWLKQQFLKRDRSSKK